MLLLQVLLFNFWDVAYWVNLFYFKLHDGIYSSISSLVVLNDMNIWSDGTHSSQHYKNKHYK